jgi:hypothetical protein
MRARFISCAAALLLIGVARPLHAQGKTLFENDSVRVFEATIKAGTHNASFHTHAHPHVTYVQSGGTLHIRHQDGSVAVLVLKTGEAYWGKVETHAADNPGSTDVVLITVDLKPRPPLPADPRVKH